MIVKNEEELLPRCLDSAKVLADEIIIVDTGSTDNTVSIAERYGTRCYSFEWQNDFSAVRNYSLQYARGEWILVLDADEWLTPENTEKIKRLTQTAKGIAFYLNFRSRIRSSAAGDYVITAHPRLFKNGLNIRFSGRIHEHITDSVHTAGGTIKPTDIFVEHEGYSDERMLNRKKIERNIVILKRELQESPENGMIYFYLGECYSLLEQWSEALQWYEEGARKKTIPPDNLALLYQNAGTAYLNSGNIPEAYRAERQSLKFHPVRVTPHIVIAESALTEGNYDLAVWEYTTVLEQTQNPETRVFDRISEHIPNCNVIRLRLGQAYFLSKDYENAEINFKVVSQSHSLWRDAQKWLTKTYFLTKRFDDALKCINDVISNVPDDVEALTLKGKIIGNSGNLDDALKYFHQALDRNPAYAEARSDAVRIQLMRGKISEAQAMIENAPGLETVPGLLKLRAEILLRTGNPLEAQAILEQLISQNQAEFETYFLTALTADALGNSDGVLHYCSEAQKMNPSDIRTYILQGNALIKKQQYQEAIAVLKTAAQRKPDVPDVWKSIGIAAVKLKDYAGAKEAYETALRLQPDDVTIKRSLAALCSKLGLLNEAEKYLLMIKTP
jgi:tetratricopeptide (TPR) repeat protein